jgi:hypothetical protein
MPLDMNSDAIEVRVGGVRDAGIGDWDPEVGSGGDVPKVDERLRLRI